MLMPDVSSNSIPVVLSIAFQLNLGLINNDKNLIHNTLSMY